MSAVCRRSEGAKEGAVIGPRGGKCLLGKYGVRVMRRNIFHCGLEEGYQLNMHYHYPYPTSVI